MNDGGSGREIDVTTDEAVNLVRSFLAARVVLTPCPFPPATIYGLDPEADLVFRVQPIEGSSGVGSSEYVTVSSKTGMVRSLGFHGE